ncbi:uncharacterized protein LOC129926639 isoform X2 [Biomphalaria glabrata]|uniref:Uncharacterized protein LOC129926639 isoform X2 n=1 Tax=Biomphalaria glabrata TaxID=6526 RepID=A0A9W3AKZ9_BIOGL|nr:uncharacterized protein LOC129926639 isoform X2 [Biomphalaria glabrata]
MVSILIFFLLQQASQVISKQVALTIDYYYGSVSSELNQYPDMCPSLGFLVETVSFQNKNCTKNMQRELNSTDLNADEKLLAQMILNKSNGRSNFSLEETLKIRPKMTCNGSPIPADKIVIKGQCLETNVNYGTVFHFLHIEELPSLKEVFIISPNQKLNKACQLTGNGSTIVITLLHLDFNNTTQLEKETDFLSIIDTDRDIYLYYNSTNYSEITFKNISVENATLQVHMINGFLWMKIKANNEATFNVTCIERGNDISTIGRVTINTFELKAITIAIGLIVVLAAAIIIIQVVLRYKKRNANSLKPGQVAQAEHCQQTENSMKRHYFQLERNPETQRFNLSDVEKSSSCDNMKKNVTMESGQELEYSHLHSTSFQKPTLTEHIYNE